MYIDRSLLQMLIIFASFYYISMHSVICMLYFTYRLYITIALIMYIFYYDNEDVSKDKDDRKE